MLTLSETTPVSLSVQPLVAQDDGTLLLDMSCELSCEARELASVIAHLVSAPHPIHTFRITPLSIWNAVALGLGARSILDALSRYCRYPVPDKLRQSIEEMVRRAGIVRLLPVDHGDFYFLEVTDAADRRHLAECDDLRPFWVETRADGFLVAAENRGVLKQALVKAAYPADDVAGYTEGGYLPFNLRPATTSGARFFLRPYQEEACQSFHRGGSASGGCGVIVLPCGSGKTVVALAAMSKLQTETLILTSSTVAVRQWRNEILVKTDLPPEAIGEYTGDEKRLAPVVLTTYQMLTHRPGGSSDFPHLELMKQNRWGLIVYDEVHLLPAAVFRTTAEIQSRRRLGLTATLVREDGREDDVFALIGPKRYEVPWKTLEQSGYIAEASCIEVRVELPMHERMSYLAAERRDKFRIAAENSQKISLVKELIASSPDDQILVIGQYISQLESLSSELDLPLVAGNTPNSVREKLYEEFRQGQRRVLLVSKVANFAIDLPDASMAIQVSGTFGSRQEEAQRLGRLLRPKSRATRFYTLVSRGTTEQDFAVKRQLFLVEQGYSYQIVNV